MTEKTQKQLENSQMNATLRRMLNTPPKQHKDKREAEAPRPSEEKSKQSVDRPNKSG